MNCAKYLFILGWKGSFLRCASAGLVIAASYLMYFSAQNENLSRMLSDLRLNCSCAMQFFFSSSFSSGNKDKTTSEATEIWWHQQHLETNLQEIQYILVVLFISFCSNDWGLWTCDAEWNFRVFTYLIWNVFKLLGSGQWAVAWDCDKTHKCELPLHK